MRNPESDRCLLCKRARCSEACPVHTDVPLAMRLYREGRLEEAGEVLFENNPLSAITSVVCDWQKLCKGHCVLNAKGLPIRWHEIEHEISTKYLRGLNLTASGERGKSVAVVGAGPAGITAAILLKQQGFGVTVFDKHELPGGVLRYGIPPYRLDKSLVNEYGRLFEELGIVFRGGEFIRDLEDLRIDFDAVLVATGAGMPRRLDIPGEDSERVIYALDFLENPSAYRLGERVLVVGGGNVTMDAARTVLRCGKLPIVYYRKGFENMPANMSEVEESKAEGVEFVLFEVPVEVLDDCVVMRKCENIIREDGSVGTRMLEGTDYEVPFDSMIVAISENVDYSILGEVGLDGAGGNVFTAGDFAYGPKTVVEAVVSAKTAVNDIMNFLNNYENN